MTNKEKEPPNGLQNIFSPIPFSKNYSGTNNMKK